MNTKRSETGLTRVMPSRLASSCSLSMPASISASIKLSVPSVSILVLPPTGSAFCAAILDETLLSQTEHARIEAASAQDPALQRRLEGLHFPQGLLTRAYDLAAMDAPQMPAALRAQLAAAATETEPPAADAANTNKAPGLLWPLTLAASFARGMVAYLDDRGQPLAFCLTMRDAEDRDAATWLSWNLAAASWITEGVGFVLVDEKDQTRVAEIAEQFRGVI